MRLKEQRLWDRMRSNTDPIIKLQRIENMHSDGIPDVLACCLGIVTFCELKCAAGLPARSTTRLLGGEGLSVDQRNWHLDWRKHGGRSIIVVGVNNLPHHWALDSAYADSVNDMTTADLTEHATAFALARKDGAAFWFKLSGMLSR
jgi:hypothetical protein